MKKAGNNFTEKGEKLEKILKNKFIYGGYYTGTVEDDVSSWNYNEPASIPKYKKVFSKAKYSNIHLFNELAELKNEHEFFNELINPEIYFGPWEIDKKYGFLKLGVNEMHTDNFNKDSEGNQIFTFKID